MGQNLTPRQVAKRLLSGDLPRVPLFLPIVFSLGARVENVPIRTFLSNPTKICNALRQIRSHLSADGVACYFDSLLEFEALGATLRWETENGPVTWQWPGDAVKGELPQGLRSAEEAVKSGRVPAAVEVIRRMNVVPQREFLLMAGIRGPFTLAARLTQVELEKTPTVEDFPQGALELSAAVITQLASAFVEAGADAVFIQEDALPSLNAEECAVWASLLAPTINVIRFYEALPVLLLTNDQAFFENFEMILGQQWDCVVCASLEGLVSERVKKSDVSKRAMLGISLPLEAFRADESSHDDFCKTLRSAISQWEPVILTTAGDVPLAADMKYLARVSEVVRAGSNISL